MAVNERRHGGNGDIWIADGYGSNRVYGYDATGNIPRRLMERREQALSFVRMGYGSILAKDRLELYIDGHGNHRVQVYEWRVGGRILKLEKWR